MEQPRHEEEQQRDQAAAASAMRLGFRDFLAAVEGLLLPDRPSVPGKTRLNMSLFPRSRLRMNPHLRVQKPRLPSPPKPGT
jgi:hypothetical protein